VNNKKGNSLDFFSGFRPRIRPQLMFGVQESYMPSKCPHLALPPPPPPPPDCFVTTLFQLQCSKIVRPFYSLRTLLVHISFCETRVEGVRYPCCPTIRGWGGRLIGGHGPGNSPPSRHLSTRSGLRNSSVRWFFDHFIVSKI
jgi:hypothetical protein